MHGRRFRRRRAAAGNDRSARRHDLGAPQATHDHPHAEHDKGNAQPLPHVERPALLEGLLLDLDELDEEACQEDAEQSDAEEHARTPPRKIAAVVEPAQHAEGREVAQRLVDLRRMHGARHLVGEVAHPSARTDELEAPRERRGRTVNLRVEEVAQANDGAADADGDHDPVERPDIGQPVAARKEPQTDEQTHRSAVAGHTALAEARDDGPRLAQIAHRFVEQAMAQSCADDGGERSVDENRLRNRRGKPLAFAEVIEEFGADQNRQRPHQSVVTDVEASEPEQHRIEIPYDSEKMVHTHLLLEPHDAVLSVRRTAAHELGRTAGVSQNELRATSGRNRNGCEVRSHRSLRREASRGAAARRWHARRGAPIRFI